MFIASSALRKGVVSLASADSPWDAHSSFTGDGADAPADAADADANAHRAFYGTRGGAMTEEAINRLFCPSQEKFHTFVLRGLRNISEAP